MEQFTLVKPGMEYAEEIRSYRQEFLDSGETSIAGGSGLENFESAEAWLGHLRLLENPATVPEGMVEAEEFMLVRKSDRRVLGLVHFRHTLNPYLAEYGGHIGYSVRPSERRKGYATRQLALCLAKARQFGLERVLITCGADNEGSRRTILANGGIFERLAEGQPTERYWVPLDPIEHAYNVSNEERRFESQTGRVEFLTTMRYITRYLTHGARILEIGAATGRYSLALADMGYSVDAVELAERNIERFRAKMRPEQRVTVRKGNALDLSEFADGAYDITLLLGPLYHLVTPEDKRRAIAEALRVTKPGGIVFAAYCLSDASVIFNGIIRKRYSIPDYIAEGLIDPVTFKTRSKPELFIEMVRTEDINELMEEFPNTNRLHFVGTDMLTLTKRDEIDAMPPEEYELYLRYHFTICERSDMVGISHHVLDVFRRNA